MKSDQKYQYRTPKQARSRSRFDEILSRAEHYIELGQLEDFALSDLAQDIGIPVGSAYHFFPSKEAVLVALIHRIHDVFEKVLRKTASAPADTWHTLGRIAVEAVYDAYGESSVARTLILGPGYIWPVRLADAERNAANGRTMIQILGERFGTPTGPAADAAMVDAITIVDALFRKSYEEFGMITEPCLAGSVEEITAFLERRFAQLAASDAR